MKKVYIFLGIIFLMIVVYYSRLQLKNEVREELKEEIKVELKEEIKTELKTELKEEIELEIISDLIGTTNGDDKITNVYASAGMKSCCNGAGGVWENDKCNFESDFSDEDSYNKCISVFK